MTAKEVPAPLPPFPTDLVAELGMRCLHLTFESSDDPIAQFWIVTAWDEDDEPTDCELSPKIRGPVRDVIHAAMIAQDRRLLKIGGDDLWAPNLLHDLDLPHQGFVSADGISRQCDNPKHSTRSVSPSVAPPVLSEEDREWHTEAEVFGPKMFESYHQLRAAGYDEAWVYAKLGIDFKTGTLPPLVGQWKPRGSLRDMAWRICALQGHDDGEPLNPCPACQAEIRDYFFPPAALAPPSSPIRLSEEDRAWLEREAKSLDEDSALFSRGSDPLAARYRRILAACSAPSGETERGLLAVAKKWREAERHHAGIVLGLIEGDKSAASDAKDHAERELRILVDDLTGVTAKINAAIGGRLSEEVQKERTK